jgi:DNA repair protein RadC
VLNYLYAELAHAPAEHVRVLYLDAKNHLLRDALITIGSINEAPIYPREIMRQALEVNATGMILVHNHPSGDPTPSVRDTQITKLVANAARLLDIQLHDHLIIARAGHVSFRAAGLL